MNNNFFTQNDIEDIILGMADLVLENRILRKENDRLHKVEKEYHEEIEKRYKESQEASLNILKAVCAGIDKGLEMSSNDNFINKGGGIK